MLRFAAAGLAALFVSAHLWADESSPSQTGSRLLSDKTIETLLEPIREKHEVAGLIAGIVDPPGLRCVGVVGVRKFDSPEPMTVNDKIHLGSDTKAMTATLLAMLVQEGKLAWTTTLGGLFPDEKSQFHADFAGVTVEQLLSHRAGLPANVGYFAFNKGSLVEQREAMMRKVLAEAPEHPPGTKFLYSNVGYIIAGHVAEKLTGTSWEDLMTARLFEPLKMSSAGFGPPGTKGRVDQPWGHRSFFGLTLAEQTDNPPMLGPAGTVHCSLADWASFVSLHLRAGRGMPSLLKHEAFDAMHTPPAGEPYALGWGKHEEPYIDGPLLMHAGSNTFWFALVAISTKHNVAFLVAANRGPEAGAKACQSALEAMVGHAGLRREGK